MIKMRFIYYLRFTAKGYTVDGFPYKTLKYQKSINAACK